MDDRCGSDVDHRWDDSAIEAHRSQQVYFQRLGPQLWGELGEPAGGGRHTATGDVDDDVDAPVVGDLLDQSVGSLDGRNVGGDERVRG